MMRFEFARVEVAESTSHSTADTGYAIMGSEMLVKTNFTAVILFVPHHSHERINAATDSVIKVPTYCSKTNFKMKKKKASTR